MKSFKFNRGKCVSSHLSSLGRHTCAAIRYGALKSNDIVKSYHLVNKLIHIKSFACRRYLTIFYHEFTIIYVCKEATHFYDIDRPTPAILVNNSTWYIVFCFFIVLEKFLSTISPYSRILMEISKHLTYTYICYTHMHMVIFI